jgi:hypothetical protein
VAYRSTAFAGHYLYAASYNSSAIIRIDLAAGTAPTYIGMIPDSNNTSSAIAADNTNVWAVSPYTNVLSRIDPTTGTATTITNLPGSGTNVLLSVGGYLYASVAGGLGFTTVYRIEKATGTWQLVAGSGTAGLGDGSYSDAMFAGITGIASDGTSLYVSDSAAGVGTFLRVLGSMKSTTADGGPSGWRETAGGQNPSENGHCFGCAADPVQTDTGALLESAVDVQLTGGRGIELGMSRTYSSAGASTGSTVGYGWASPYAMKLTPAATALGTAYVMQENGSAAADGDSGQERRRDVHLRPQVPADRAVRRHRPAERRDR